ncbi:hypothetical protein Pelo_17139 [Pelomyxa schiedti]|nr:hypothetical protein Pelo_17139 [Pelomyxa schiedti]
MLRAVYDAVVEINCGTRARSQLVQLLFAHSSSAPSSMRPTPHNPVQSAPSSDAASGRSSSGSDSATPLIYRCHVGVLPLWVLVELIGKRWVMWPERRVLVHCANGEEDGYGRDYLLFFSVGPTLGLVHKPVVVSMKDFCFGWTGGNTIITHIREEVKQLREGHKGAHFDAILEFNIDGIQGCCNQRWVVIAGVRKSTNESGLFVCKVDNTQLDSCWNVMKYPWANSVRFFGSSEFDFESDVLEVIFTEERGTDKFWCVVHINLNCESGSNPLRVIGECNLSQVGIAEWCLPKPLVDRRSHYPSLIYYFLLGETGREAKVLVLDTGQVVTLIEGTTHSAKNKHVVQAVDETHLSLTKTGENGTTTSVYSLSELISSATSLPPPPHSAAEVSSSCFDKVTPIHVHHFEPESVVAVGCGIVTSSSQLSPWHQSPEPKRPRLSKKRDTLRPFSFNPPRVLMSHEFIDATTGTVLFTVKQADNDTNLLPVYIQPVPFHNPLG